MPYENVKFDSILDVKILLAANYSKLKCRGVCRKGLSITQLEGYPEYEHDGGIRIGDKRYWLYLHCLDRKCGYDTALWKLRIEGLE